MFVLKTRYPKVVQFSTTVSIPVYVPIVISRDIGIREWEDFFDKLRGMLSYDPATSKQFELCKMTMKWAGLCNAESVKIESKGLGNERLLECTFSFRDAKNMTNFADFFADDPQE